LVKPAAAGGMNTPSGTSVVDVQRYDPNSVSSVIPVIARLYEVVYREPPYCEGAKDVAEFVEGMPRRAARPAFRLVVATTDGKPVGFAFGHQRPTRRDGKAQQHRYPTRSYESRRVAPSPSSSLPSQQSIADVE
jgi:hypothetical protein